MCFGYLVYLAIFLLCCASSASPCPAGCTCIVLKRSDDQPPRRSPGDLAPTSTTVGSGEDDGLALPPPLHTSGISPGKKVVCSGMNSIGQIRIEDVPADTIHLWVAVF